MQSTSVRHTKDTTYLKVRNFERFSLKLSVPKLERERANMQIRNGRGTAYHGLIDPRSLRTSEAPEDAMQGVYRLSHAI